MCYKLDEVMLRYCSDNVRKRRKRNIFNLWPDPVGHFGDPWWPFWIWRRCGIAGGERVPPLPLGIPTNCLSFVVPIDKDEKLACAVDHPWVITMPTSFLGVVGEW